MLNCEPGVALLLLRLFCAAAAVEAESASEAEEAEDVVGVTGAAAVVAFVAGLGPYSGTGVVGTTLRGVVRRCVLIFERYDKQRLGRPGQRKARKHETKKPTLSGSRSRIQENIF